MLSYFLRCAVPQDESKLFCHILFFCKNVYPIVKSYSKLSWRWVKYVANQTTIYDYMALGFCSARPSFKISHFTSQASLSWKKTVISKLYELRNVVLSIIFWIQPTWAANYCRQHWYRATAYISSYFSHVSICHVWSAWHNYVVVGSLR